MLQMPEETSSIVPIIGIDPGSQKLGIAILYVDLRTWTIVSSRAMTAIGTKLPGGEGWKSEIHGERLCRIFAHEENLYQLFSEVKPLYVACESPFINMKRPQAYGALMEVISACRNALTRFDPWKILYLIDPPTVKRAVGASGNADKDGVRTKILALTELNYQGDTPLHWLDEHSNDALAVAYCHYLNIKASLISLKG